MTDVIFKLLFGSENSVEILTDFLLAVLKLSPDEYDSIIVTNPFLLQEYRGDKLGILDIKLKLKSGKVLNIEMQVDPAKFMESRVVFYTSKMITGQISEGANYGKIKPVISIIIAGHTLIKESDSFHHHFSFYDAENKVKFTDMVEIHTLEMPKAREAFKDGNDSHLLNWMKFLDAKTEEELNMVAVKNPTIKKATLKLMELSADEKARQLYEDRLQMQRDNYARQQWAVDEAVTKAVKDTRESEKLNIAKYLLSVDTPVDTVLAATGLTLEDISGF